MDAESSCNKPLHGGSTASLERNAPLSEGELSILLSCAFKCFFTCEETLLQVNASERSMTHKLAEHMQKVFIDEGLTVDCEYNRHGWNPKRIPNLVFDVVEADEQEAKTVFPDIIVHKRGNDECNVLVIEVKKLATSDRYENDTLKLEAFTNQSGEYRYDVGLLVVLDVARKLVHSIRCFQNGKEKIESSVVTKLKELGYGG